MRYSKVAIALTVIFVLTATLATTEIPNSEFRTPTSESLPIYEQWESFTTEDGLLDDHAYWVKVDKINDCVWAGTDNGLACYQACPEERGDGKWKVYTPADGLAHQAVMGVDVDGETGDVWIATFGGLSRFSAGRFQTYTQFNSGLANDVLYGVAVHGDSVWVATTAGASRFIKKTGELRVYDSQNAPMDENWCYNVSAGEGKVFFAVWGGGFLEYDLAADHWQAYEDPDGEFEIDLFRDDGPVHNITTGASYTNGILWGSTYFGLSTYNFRRWRNYNQYDSALASDFINVVRAQPGTRNGWSCTDKGLSMLNYDTEQWVNYTPEEIKIYKGKELLETRKRQTIAHQFVYGVDWDGDNVVWVATSHGISRGTRIRNSELKNSEVLFRLNLN
jgi:ligand-binding sensor domain-containing protein